MSNAIGASSANALSYLQSLLQQATAGAKDAKGAKGASASDPLSMFMQTISDDDAPPDQTGSAAPLPNAASGPSCPPFSSDTMSALLTAQGQQSAGGRDAKLFAKLDTDGDGQISKTEFDSAASKAGADSSVADAVFAKIDADGDGAVSQDELAKADHGGGHHRMRVGGGGGGQDPLDALTSATDTNGATTQTSTNADGSTTTTISYADGSKIDMTTPAAASSASASATDSSSNKGKFNLLEQLIKLQSHMLTAASSTMSAMV